MIEIEIYTREGCAFCPRAKEILEEVASEFGDKVKITEIDTDKEKEKSDNLGVAAVPTIIISRDMRLTGVPRPEILREAIQKEIGLVKDEERRQE